MWNVTHILVYLQILTLLIMAAVLLRNPKAAKAIETGITDAEKAVGAVTPLLEATPVGAIMNVCDEALKAAQTGVKYAEQLFQNGTLSSDQRKNIASQYAANYVQQLGMDVSPRLAQVIDGAIEAAVYLLPPSKADASTIAPSQPTAPTAG